MRKNPTRRIVVLMILAVITYELANGIRYGSTWGIVMSIASLLALFVALQMFKKLAQLKEEEEREKERETTA